LTFRPGTDEFGNGGLGLGFAFRVSIIDARYVDEKVLPMYTSSVRRQEETRNLENLAHQAD
jgi:hypothetical protein